MRQDECNDVILRQKVHVIHGLPFGIFGFLDYQNYVVFVTCCERRMGWEREGWVGREKDGLGERMMGWEREGRVEKKKDGLEERRMG